VSEVDPDLWFVALHEAGHAIAAAAQGVTVEVVTIIPDVDRDTLGHCLPARLGEERDDREKEIILTLAGPAVDESVNHRQPDHRWFSGRARPRSLDDWGKAYGQAKLLTERVCLPESPRQVGAYLRWLYDRARHLVAHDPNREAIGILARRLVREKTLGNQAVREAYGSGKGVSRRRTVRCLRDLDVLRHDDGSFPLDRLLAALDECESGRRRPWTVRKELEKEGRWLRLQP
jgi:hypothetical protein